MTPLASLLATVAVAIIKALGPIVVKAALDELQAPDTANSAQTHLSHYRRMRDKIDQYKHDVDGR